MYCENCGKEIADSCKYCNYCGHKLIPEQEKNTNFYCNLKIFVLILCILAGILAIILILIFIATSKLNNNSSVLSVIKNKADTKINTEESSTITVKEGSTLLVAVPTEYANLRNSPGLGEDIIMQIKPGTYMSWNGENTKVGDDLFYHITLVDQDMDGYISADFCTEVQQQYDETKLDIVNTLTSMYDYEMFEEDLKMMSEKYGNYMKYQIIGSSEDSRNIYKLELGNSKAEHKILIQAGIHGREYMTTQLVMKMIEYYCNYYEMGQYNNIPYKELFDKTSIQIIAMSNPDGVTVSQYGIESLNNPEFKQIVKDCYERDKKTLIYEEDSNGDMNWHDFYKDEDYIPTTKYEEREITFDEYQTLWKANARGVDLNNNFNAEWNAIDLKEMPSYGSYRGDFPLSESESVLLFNEAQKYQYLYYLSYHAKGGLIYYNTAGNTIDNMQKSLDLATSLEKITKYKPVDTSNATNVNMGGFGDWVQLGLNKPSVTIEIGKHPCPLKKEEFQSIWLRNRESWVMLCYEIYKN